VSSRDPGPRAGAILIDGRVEHGIRGWALRLVLGACAAIAAAISMTEAPVVGVTSVAGFVLMLLVIGTAAAPGSVEPMLFLLAVVLYRLVPHGSLLDGGLAALVALVPIIHQLAGLAAAIPVRSLVSWRVLMPAALRLVIVVVPVEVALLVYRLL
jgi:hypothetical protein